LGAEAALRIDPRKTDPKTLFGGLLTDRKLSDSLGSSPARGEEIGGPPFVGGCLSLHWQDLRHPSFALKYWSRISMGIPEDRSAGRRIAL
jgi:hypothetical protein